MSRYTKGPWSASGIRSSGQGLAKEKLLSVLRPDGASCAFVIYSDLTPEDHVQAHADQRLIAAAPELYEALKCAQLWVSTIASVYPGHRRKVETLRAI